MRQTKRIETLRTDARLVRLARLLDRAMGTFAETQAGDLTILRIDRLRQLLRRERHRVRNEAVLAISRDGLDAGIALERMDAVRWLHRVTYHLWRIEHHRQIARAPAPDLVARR